MNKIKIVLGLLLVSFVFSGFWSDDRSKREIKNEERKNRFIEQQSRIKTSRETLNLLYKQVPKVRTQLLKSYGYATFSNVGVNVILFSVESGEGLAHSNRSGINTYMNMQSGGLGIGLGARDFRAIFLFKTKRAYDKFVKSGWEANAQADAAASYDETGGATGGAITISKDIILYKLTKDGLIAQITIQGTKYYKDENLNKFY